MSDEKKINTIVIKLKRMNNMFKLLILLGIIIGIPLYIYFFQHQWIDTFSSLDSTKAFLEAHKTGNIFLLLGLQVLQIVISVIPGQWIQFAAGFTYGFLFGLILSVAGAMIGTVIAYYLADFMGRDAMHMLFGEEKIKHYTEMLNSKKGIIAVFLIYLIPGVPKDLCCYAAGLSDMKLKPFLLVSTVGRLPGMAGSILIGKFVDLGGYDIAIIICAAAIVLFTLGVIFRKKLMAWIDKAYTKIEEME
jgi:Uncharacterized conserved protein